MSWIKELAVKAEAALERIDSQTAAVLKKEKSPYGPSNISSTEHKRSSSYNIPNTERSSTINYETANWSVSAHNSVNCSAEEYKTRKRNIDSFDNNQDTTLHSRQSSSSSFDSSSLTVPGSERESPALSKRDIDTSVDSGHVGSVGVIDGQQHSFGSSSSSSDLTNHSEAPTTQQEYYVTSASMSETELLRKEVTSLNQEMQQVLRRAKNAECDNARLKTELSTLLAYRRQNQPLLVEGRQIDSELQDELNATSCQKTSLPKSETDSSNDILGEQAQRSLIEVEDLQSLKSKYEEVHFNLLKEEKSNNILKKQFSDRIKELEDTQKLMGIELSICQQQLESERQTNNINSYQVSKLKSKLADCRREFDEYKVKAGRILNSKQVLFDKLMQVNGEEAFTSDTLYQEMSRLKREQDLLQEELDSCGKIIHSLLDDISEDQLSAEKEVESVQNKMMLFEKNLSLRQDSLSVAKEQKLRAEQELQILQEESATRHHSLNKRLQERDEEIGKLRKQIAHKISSSIGTYELENRIHSLTEALILKQNNIESLSAQKHTLRIQCEKLQEQYSEADKLLNTDVKIYVEDCKTRQPSFMTESPSDGGMTRHVKKAYGCVDKFSIRLGTFLRRYPVARLFILMYMGILHMWVMIVLFTYTPEIHSSVDFKG